VFASDGFRCRYCSRRLVSRRVLTRFKASLNSPRFTKRPRDSDSHGVYLIHEPCADHVEPWSLGGRTTPANLVTSCNPCNYGKDLFTVEQLGLDNPRFRAPKRDGWDGLISYLEEIP